MLLLLADPTVICYQHSSHQAVVAIAALAALLVIIGYPIVLLCWVLPEVDRAVRGSPAASTLAEAELVMEEAVTYNQSHGGSDALHCGACIGGRSREPNNSSRGRKHHSGGSTSGPISHASSQMTLRRVKRSYIQDQDRAQRVQEGLVTSGPAMHMAKTKTRESSVRFSDPMQRGPRSLAGISLSTPGAVEDETAREQHGSPSSKDSSHTLDIPVSVALAR